ncbi:MAG: hypothetical protein EBQ65_06545 [Chitinophagaceae bacterium]|nr:hypothetical protein [Chitinophagaceae bacterium]
MAKTDEIAALYTLIDDPDEEVFGVVSDRIVNYGTTIIPTLEHWWETTPNEQVQNRIENLIHRLQFRDLRRNFTDWKHSPRPELFTGALLCATFHFPELATAPVIADLEKLRRNIWLELNNYLTPLEQVNVFHNILYGYYGLRSIPRDESKPDHFLINKIITGKKGTQAGNGLLYLILCEQLDLPVRAIQLPNQFILAYIKNGGIENNRRAEFFMDPTGGQIFTHKDIETYFKRINEPLEPSYLQPLSNTGTIAKLIDELSSSFDASKEAQKIIELQELSAFLKS